MALADEHNPSTTVTLTNDGGGTATAHFTMDRVADGSIIPPHSEWGAMDEPGNDVRFTVKPDVYGQYTCLGKD